MFITTRTERNFAEKCRIEQISKWISMNFWDYFSPLESIELQILEMNQFNFEQIQFLIIDSNLSLESKRTNQINFHQIFYMYVLPFRIKQIANFGIEQNKFRTNSKLTLPPIWLFEMGIELLLPAKFLSYLVKLNILEL